mgnify:CR=1 FL=1
MRNRDYEPGGKGYIYVNKEDVLKIDAKYIEGLKEKAKTNGYQRCMMCLHHDIRSHVHEMMNVFARHQYIRPHCHPNKTETKSIVEGKVLMIIFDKGGQILEQFVLSKEDGDVFTVRIEKNIYHTNIALTDAVFHEIIEGPYTGRDDSVFPEWAPEEEDQERVSSFLKQLNLENFELGKEI